MMVIYYGQRHYGRVDVHRTGHVATLFAHIYWLPLMPMGSMWVTQQAGNEYRGFRVKLSWKSIAATYLRIWAPIIAVGVAATLSVAGLVAAAVLAGLSAWSWTWRRPPGGREARRAVFNEVAFHVACDPLRRPASHADELRPIIDQGFAEVSNGRTPDDIVRFGADTPMQAAMAYATLRLVAASTRGDARRKAREASERILDGLKDADAGALADGGPYRARGAAPGVDTRELDAAAAAARHASDQAFQDHLRAKAADRWDKDPENPAIKAEIAANKAKRAKRDKVGVAFLIVVGAAVGVFVVRDTLAEREAASRGMAELRRFRDDVCACTTSACLTDLFAARDEAAQRAERAALTSSSNRDAIDALVDDVERCVRQLPP